MFEAKERIAFPGEDKFIVVGPCGDDPAAVYTTHPTMKGATKIAARMNAEAEALEDFNNVASRHHY